MVHSYPLFSQNRERDAKLRIAVLIFFSTPSCCFFRNTPRRLRLTQLCLYANRFQSPIPGIVGNFIVGSLFLVCLGAICLSPSTRS